MTPARYLVELESMAGADLPPVEIRLRRLLRTARRALAFRVVAVRPARQTPPESEPNTGATGAQKGREKRHGRLEI